MNGAESLLRTLTAHGVEVCFGNPGTSEMHFVAALDKVDGMRCILGLFEGVVTGAADGYGRMLDRPAATLLHLGPGLANGLSNLHNAKKAYSPVVNIVGDHATGHLRYDAPLTSDIEGTARPYSNWVRRTLHADHAAADGAAAVAAARSAPGQVASLILPADAAWNELSADHPGGIAPLPSIVGPGRPADAAIDAAAEILRSAATTAILLAGRATRADSLVLAGQIAARTGARLYAQTYSPRIARGAGRVAVERLPYPVDQALEVLKDVQNIVLVGAKPPVAFFAYPDRPSEFAKPGTRLHTLARADQDIPYALQALATALGAGGTPPPVADFAPPERPTGPITPEKIGRLLCAALPEDAIVVDESITTGRSFLPLTRSARPHDWLLPTGGSIGYAMPVAIGAAVACPDRKVVVLESDGSGLFMPQSLWTQAREGLNVLTLVFSNRRYQILLNEMRNVGASVLGPRSSSLLEIGDPDIDWSGLAASFGVAAFRATSMEELGRHFDAGLAIDGPCLIEVALQ